MTNAMKATMGCVPDLFALRIGARGNEAKVGSVVHTNPTTIVNAEEFYAHLDVMENGTKLTELQALLNDLRNLKACPSGQDVLFGVLVVNCRTQGGTWRFRERASISDHPRRLTPPRAINAKDDTLRPLALTAKEGPLSASPNRWTPGLADSTRREDTCPQRSQQRLLVVHPHPARKPKTARRPQYEAASDDEDRRSQLGNNRHRRSQQAKNPHPPILGTE
ncbi:conserved hypothetical protein [Culex quinquefasciatus]|uniref:Uncharacterized protein n=1 Tax=Culex quinquefasciatus TaxID=7176 RepID=B0W164_CULQU|nr:conserved hypothetical protein [Culex quinquefasciatus]|eukprot:XP_001842448.1 conserved hypothetical protein [Culex quinquefasciatus]